MRIPSVATVDYHTAGEPFRIVENPPLSFASDTVADRRTEAIQSPEIDRVRQLLCFEPRGHADMYGGFITPPDDSGAHFGVLFWHKDGFSTACGHGTIALGVWAVQTGRVPMDSSGVTDVVVDVPSGRVTARVYAGEHGIAKVEFINIPSYVLAREVAVTTSRGPLVVDIAYGGAIYATVDASSVGLTVAPEHYSELIAIGREIKDLLNVTEHARHPVDDRLDGIYATILVDNLGITENGDLHQRNVTVFADGQVDRSPCGSGTCARVALLADAGDLTPDRTLLHDSIVGSQFRASVTGEVRAAGRRAFIPRVGGMAYRTGRHTFELDPNDPLDTGFVLR